MSQLLLILLLFLDSLNNIEPRLIFPLELHQKV